VVPPKPAPISADVDEFDEAFDLTADDLDEILSQQPLHQRSLYDIPEYTGPPPRTDISSQAGPAPLQKLQPPIVLNDEDEFGDDDLDEESFVQAEFSATQAMKRVSQRSHE
jgi:DNA replication ATP-dependent helicase Dna2